MLADGIRKSQFDDFPAIAAIYSSAFPSEDLLPLVKGLLTTETGVLSLVALLRRQPVGHVAFTICGIEGQSGPVALLAPLAVSPDQQRQGIGSLLVHEGLRRLKEEKVLQAFVLGDPAYYRRFGFMPDDRVVPPYPLPSAWQAAWQSARLQDNDAPLQGRLVVPEIWRQPSLWT